MIDQVNLLRRYAGCTAFVLLMGVLVSFCARRARMLAPTSAMPALGNACVLAFL